MDFKNDDNNNKKQFFHYREKKLCKFAANVVCYMSQTSKNTYDPCYSMSNHLGDLQFGTFSPESLC